MTSLKKTKKSIIKLTLEEVQDLQNDYCGICRNCQEIADCVEPDASNYFCDSCEKKEVFGIDNLLLMGDIDIVE